MRTTENALRIVLTTHYAEAGNSAAPICIPIGTDSRILQQREQAEEKHTLVTLIYTFFDELRRFSPASHK